MGQLGTVGPIHTGKGRGNEGALGEDTWGAEWTTGLCRGHKAGWLPDEATCTALLAGGGLTDREDVSRVQGCSVL